MSTIEDSARAFAGSAARFVELVERDPGSEEERIRALRPLLARLYAQALELEQPSDIEDVEDAERTNKDELRRTIGNRFPTLGLYWCRCDPLDFASEPVGAAEVGDAIDDLLDIHGDLSEGLVYWRARHARLAVFQWLCLFEVHWGVHVLDLLRVLHEWCNKDGASEAAKDA